MSTMVEKKQNFFIFINETDHVLIMYLKTYGIIWVVLEKK